jgi:1-acyl-sn-glycerol-3-phosphate acyltransferase
MRSKFLVYAWRIWFYVLAFCITLIILPFLLLSILSEKTFKVFFFLGRLWSAVIFYGIGMRYKLLQGYKPDANSNYIIIANHTSMLDIMLMFIVVKNNPFVFVGKAELAKVPVFGFIYKRTCILVDRNNSKSKQNVYKRAANKIDSGVSVCIFPEGGVNDDESVVLDPFKDGAFRLAIEHELPILPITFYGLKEFFPFIKHKGKPGKVLVKIHEPIEVKNLSLENKKQLKEQCYNLILNQLYVFKSKL